MEKSLKTLVFTVIVLGLNCRVFGWGGGDDWIEPGIPRYHYRFPDGTDFVAIAAGWDHILALTAEGEILSWN